MTAALDWSRVLLAIISAISTGFGIFLGYRLKKARQMPVIEGAAVERDLRIGEAWAELTRYTEQRLREADARMAAMQEEHRDCEQLLLTAQSEVEHLKRQLVARVKRDE